MSEASMNQTVDAGLMNQIDQALENFSFAEEPATKASFVELGNRYPAPSAKERIEMQQATNRPLSHYMLTDVLRPTFKTDAVGSLILRFDVLKSALQGKDTPELRLDLSSHINAMMTSARALLVSDAGLIRKNLVRLEAAGINVALCPEESGDGHLLILFAQNVGFRRKVYLRKFITTT